MQNPRQTTVCSLVQLHLLALLHAWLGASIFFLIVSRRGRDTCPGWMIILNWIRTTISNASQQWKPISLAIDSCVDGRLSVELNLNNTTGSKTWLQRVCPLCPPWGLRTRVIWSPHGHSHQDVRGRPRFSGTFVEQLQIFFVHCCKSKYQRP